MLCEITDKVYLDPSRVSAVIKSSFGLTAVIMNDGTKIVVDRELLSTVNLINEYKRGEKCCALKCM